MLYKHTSLQRLFLIPFLVLMTCLAVMIAVILYRADVDISDAVSRRSLEAMSAKVQSNTELQLSSAHVILNAIAPNSFSSNDKNLNVTLDFPRDMSTVEERLWMATGLFPNINNFAYFGDEQGRFVGIRRMMAEGIVEMASREANANTSTVYSMSGLHHRLAVLRTNHFDPRERPWYKAAVLAKKPVWSQVYIDFATRVPLVTLAKPIYDPDQQLIGVVGTDVILKEIGVYLQTLFSKTKGIAYLVDGNGAMIASSANDLIYSAMDASHVQNQLASDNVNPLVHASYEAALEHLKNSKNKADIVHFEVNTDAGVLHVAAAPLRDDFGLNWTSIVAIPNTSTLAEISKVTVYSVVAGFAVIGLILLFGYWTLRWTLNDIRKLTEAARRVSLGESFDVINIHRDDEIGVLAHSFREMERNLQSDALTQLLNREAFIAQIEFRRRRFTDKQNLHFAILFIDLDHFKAINDNFGHESGDLVLIEIGQRLKSSIRKDDLAARFGGDEFVVYLHGVHQADLLDSVCEKLRSALELPINLGMEQRGKVGAAIGAALYPDDGQDIETLFRVADVRMFANKHARKQNAGEHKSETTGS